MRARFVRRSIFISGLLVLVGLLSFHPSWLSIEGTTSAQDPNATLPAPKKTPTPKTTTPPPKKRTPRNSRTSPAKSSDSATAAEMIFWNSIKDSTNPDDFKEYLKKYPDGEFADLAKNRLKKIEAEQPKAPTSENTEPEYWETIRNSKDAQDFKDYLQAYPNGVHAAIAGLKIKQLEAAKTTTPANTSPANSSSTTLPRTRTNQAGIEFVLIPAGSFMMGSTNGRDNEKPVHQVTISQAFYMGRYEVTQGQWQTVMGSNPSNFNDCGGNCPVEQVSWDDAQNFINKLNESNDGFRYRLPTEAEWEYACRAGTTGDYPGTLSEMAWYSENSGSKTHAVGWKQPNAWGLADMHGNVWEWCQDWYHETYYGAPTDGSAWLSGGEQKYRVLRGGSWYYVATVLRSAFRYSVGPPVARSYNVGFRVVAIARTS